MKGKFIQTYDGLNFVNPTHIKRAYISKDIARKVKCVYGESITPYTELKGYWLDVHLGGKDGEYHIAHYDTEEEAKVGLKKFVESITDEVLTLNSQISFIAGVEDKIS